MSSSALSGGVPAVGHQCLHHLETVMGTIVSIDVYAEDGEPGADGYLRLARARAVLQRADAVFSTWKADSPMSRLRHGEIAVEQAPTEVAEVLARCEQARELSRGWFDPWAMPGGLDPTGLVKGWAAQRALTEFISSEVSGALVNAAGDIASFGGPEPGTPFRVGIADPFSPRTLACAVELSGAIATSGSYERGAHLLDPHLRRPKARVASASVTGPDLGLADALATAVAVAGEEGLAFVESIEGYHALLIALDGSWLYTDRFPFAPFSVALGRSTGAST